MVVLGDEDAGQAVHREKSFLSRHRSCIAQSEVVGMVDDKVVHLVMVIIKLFVVQF